MSHSPIAMVEADAYKGIEEGEVRMYLQLEGWAPTKLIHAPGDVYTSHKHPEEKLLVILAGSMRLRIGRDWTTLLPGDKAIIDGDVEHEASMGKGGCTFFWAERMPEPSSDPSEK